MKTAKNTIKRVPKRGAYDKETIYKILDTQYLCHVGFQHEGHPIVIPTLYGRKDNYIYLHGAVVSRMMKVGAAGQPLCISVASIQALVLARSAFHHSANYSSVVVFGQAEEVPEKEKEQALKIISDHIIPGRWEESRLPTPKELAITSVIRIPIEEASAKVREGGPVDDQRDLETDIWAGIVPLQSSYGTPEKDALLAPEIATPPSVYQLLNKS